MNKHGRHTTAARILVPTALATAALAGSFSVREARADKGEGYTEIEGAVAGVSGTCPTLSFTIAKTRITTGGETEFDDGECADVANGRRVEVKGTLQDDGTLLAKKVDLD